MRDSLLAGRARWDKSRPREYVLAARELDSWVALYGPPKYETHMPAVVVHGDSLVGGVWARSTRGRYAQWLGWTVDSVFTLLEDSVRDSTRQIAVLKLHPTLGYPLEWNVDDSRNGWGYEWISDSGISGRVEWFSVEPKYVVCRWWHRIRGRCWRLRSPA